MVFNSFAYLIFFPIVVAIYFATPTRFRWMIVLASSYAFYMSWEPRYALLLVAITLVNWYAALRITANQKTTAKKVLLTLGITLNVCTLIFFKYFDFMVTSLSNLAHYQGSDLLLHLALPIGISFYIFQSMAYLIDVYRGKLAPEHNVGRYAAFVSFFPHLVSGPILKPSSIIPQLHENKRWDPVKVKRGIFLIGTGLVKKIVIADSLSFLVDKAYAMPPGISGATLWLATYFFAFQLYCDFSGYTDIAIGSASILGYDIPDNFRQPYFSQSVAEFWRRWHISLSEWFRDYCYYPLAFALSSYGGRLGVAISVLVTFLTVGLWHGAGLTYIAMGAFFGIAIVFGTATQPFRTRVINALGAEKFPRVAKLWKIVFTFNLTALAWIFFRSGSMHQVKTIFTTIVTHFGSLDASVFSRIDIIFALCLIATVILFDIAESKKSISNYLIERPWYYHVAFAYTVVLILMIFGVTQGPRFIYFQF